MNSATLGGSLAFFNCLSPAIKNVLSKSLVLGEINYKPGRNNITSHTMCWGDQFSIPLLRDNLNCSPSTVCLLVWLVAMLDRMCSKYTWNFLSWKMRSLSFIYTNADACLLAYRTLFCLSAAFLVHGSKWSHSALPSHLYLPTGLWVFCISELPWCAHEVFSLSIISLSSSSLYRYWFMTPCCPPWKQERSFCLQPSYGLSWPAFQSLKPL